MRGLRGRSLGTRKLQVSESPHESRPAGSYCLELEGPRLGTARATKGSGFLFPVFHAEATLSKVQKLHAKATFTIADLPGWHRFAPVWATKPSRD